MPDLEIRIPEADLPGPGEEIELEQDDYMLFVANLRSASEADEVSAKAQPGELVKYVPVDITAPTSVVRHAARVFQRHQRTRVERWTLCDQAGTRVVLRRLDREPLTNVTCLQCRKNLANEGLLSE